MRTARQVVNVHLLIDLRKVWHAKEKMEYYLFLFAAEQDNSAEDSVYVCIRWVVNNKSGTHLKKNWARIRVFH
jgi:hypothetical protein